MPSLDPVNPNASPQARDLLKLLYDLSGKRILSGQHNNPGAISAHSEEAASIGGAYPAIWGQDFGFSDEAWDGVHFRPQIIDEAIRQHAAGSIITLMWHQVRPIDREPGTFKDNVCCPMDASAWEALLTGGSETHRNWLAQVDVVAALLSRLRDEHIPVLWRPYHEMNGGWFWWGHRLGPRGYAMLWRMLFQRLVHHHGLNNLLWVWNANAPADPYEDYFPGHDVVDCLATDIYRNDYKQSHHDDLARLAQGKPIAIGECGQLPTPQILQRQPLYVWFMAWSGLLMKHNTAEQVRELYSDRRTVNREERMKAEG
jgi:mannan endo-1,4-beta-mannosidase